MPRMTLMDRLARANRSLMRRRPTTSYGRIAAAQRWNSLADIGEDEVARLESLADEAGNRGAAQSRYVNADEALVDMNINTDDGFRADNPFLSDNVDKYWEQSEFLDWCHYNRIRPTPQALKQFRWETYQTLPHRQRQWIANKDDIRQALRDEGFVSPYADDLRTLRDVDDAALDYTGSKYDFMNLPVYESPEEFPNDFDYMWRY